MSRLVQCIETMQSEAMQTPHVPLLSVDPALDELPGADKENSRTQSAPADCPRKEKSIRELASKFIGLFMQAAARKESGGVLSLEQAARSLLVYERSGAEPDPGSMKTKVRRLYDICNVLGSLKLLEKVRSNAKPAFKWLGITDATRAIFNEERARSRSLRVYGASSEVDQKSRASSRAAPTSSQKRSAALASVIRQETLKLEERSAKQARTNTDCALDGLAALAANATTPHKPTRTFAPRPAAVAPAQRGVLKPIPHALPADSTTAQGRFVARRFSLSFVMTRDCPSSRSGTPTSDGSYSYESDRYSFEETPSVLRTASRASAIDGKSSPAPALPPLVSPCPVLAQDAVGHARTPVAALLCLSKFH